MDTEGFSSASTALLSVRIFFSWEDFLRIAMLGPRMGQQNRSFTTILERREIGGLRGPQSSLERVSFGHGWPKLTGNMRRSAHDRSILGCGQARAASSVYGPAAKSQAKNSFRGVAPFGGVSQGGASTPATAFARAIERVPERARCCRIFDFIGIGVSSIDESHDVMCASTPNRVSGFFRASGGLRFCRCRSYLFRRHPLYSRCISRLTGLSMLHEAVWGHRPHSRS